MAMIAASRLVPPGYHSVAPAVTALVVVALAGVLIAIELLRAYDEPRTRAVRRTLLIAAGPLCVGSLVLVAARVAPLLG